VIGLGTQDDFAYAQRFLSDTGVSSPTMLWDPSFDTWRRLGVTINSQMMLVSPDLETRTDVWFGFDGQQQEQILGLLPELSGV
jgi:hypothetical protein